MNHLKIYEEYSNEEIDSLFKNLNKVGQIDTIRISCVLKNFTPQPTTHPSWWIDYQEIFAIVNIPDRGSEEANKRAALEEIKRGEFEQILEALSPDEAEVLTKENIKKAAQSSSTLDDFIEEIGDQFTGVIFHQWEEMVEKMIATYTKAEQEEFFKAEWRSSPRKVKESIKNTINPDLRFRSNK